MKQYKNTNYLISENGKIFNKNTMKQLSTQIKQFSRSSFKREYIGLSIDKKQRWFFVSRLVAECYIPNPDNKPQVNHIDGNTLNNYYSNLEWCTQSENIKHAITNNLKPMTGELNSSAKLTRIETMLIKEEYSSSKISIRLLAYKYNVSYTTIRYILKGYTWK